MEPKSTAPPHLYGGHGQALSPVTGLSALARSSPPMPTFIGSSFWECPSPQAPPLEQVFDFVYSLAVEHNIAADVFVEAHLSNARRLPQVPIQPQQYRNPHDSPAAAAAEAAGLGEILPIETVESGQLQRPQSISNY